MLFGHFSTDLAQIFTSLLTFDADCHLHHDFFWSSFLGECHLRHDFFGMPFLPLTPRFFLSCLFLVYVSFAPLTNIRHLFHQVFLEECHLCHLHHNFFWSCFSGVPLAPFTPLFLLSFFDLLANIGIW